MKKLQEIIKNIKTFFYSIVGGQFRKRQKLDNEYKKMLFMELLTSFWGDIKTDSGQLIVNLIAIVTFICTLGKEIFARIYFFFIKTKSNPHFSYDNNIILIKIPLEYKKQKEFNIYKVDILNYYHKKNLFSRKQDKYSIDRLKMRDNTLNTSRNLHYFDYEISPIDIINFKLRGKIFIDVLFWELNNEPINKTYDLSSLLKKNEQVFKLIIDKQRKLSDENREYKLTEKQKNQIREQINSELDNSEII